MVKAPIEVVTLWHGEVLEGLVLPPDHEVIKNNPYLSMMKKGQGIYLLHSGFTKVSYLANEIIMTREIKT